MPKRILHTRATFRRAERVRGVVCYYDFGMFIFTLNDKFSKKEIESLANKFMVNQWERWGTAIVEEPEMSEVFEDTISDEKFKQISEILDDFDECVQNPDKWDKLNPEWEPPKDIKTTDCILSLLLVCGVAKATEIDEKFGKIVNTIGFDNPCFGIAEGCENEVDIWSQSLQAYADTNVTIVSKDEFPKCPLKKIGGRGGYDCREGHEEAPQPSKPKPKPRKGKKKKPSSHPVKEWGREYPNPLKGRKNVIAPKDILDTLRFCAEYGLNPIPLRPGSKQPFLETRTYLHNEPISDEDLARFGVKNVNIGINAGYNNLVFVDADEIDFDFDIDTTTVKTPGGYHYYFFTDKPVSEYYRKEKLGTKRDSYIKSQGYVVAPPSTVGGKQYKWVKKIKPKYMESKELIKLFNRKFDEVERRYKGDPWK